MSTQSPQPGTPESVDALDQATVVARAQDGDLESFERLLDEYSAPVFRLAYRMLGDRSSAEEAVQETFVRAWRKLETLTRPAAFASWLYNIATNRCLDVIRARQRHVEVPLEEDQVAGATMTSGSHPVDPGAAAEMRAEMRDLGSLLQQLPEEQRACWLLREVHGHSYEDIAMVLKIPASTVRGRIARARAFLATQMGGWR